MIRRLLLVWGMVVAMVAALVGFGVPVAAAAPGPLAASNGTATAATPRGLVTISPKRVLDTRTDIGSSQGRRKAGSTTSVDLNGAVPDGVAAVVLNVTVTDATGPGFVTVGSGVGAPLTASNLNFVKGQVVANQVIAQATFGSGPSLYLGVSAADLIVDVTGYYPTGSAYRPLTPARVLDTRRGSEPAAKSVTKLTLAGRAGIPTTGVAAAVLNVTAVDPAGPGFVTAYPAGAARPTASNLNYGKGAVVPAMVIAPLGSGGAIDLYTLAKAGLVVDVAGWIPTERNYHSLTPARLVDTRIGLGAPEGKVPGNTQITLQAAGHGGVPATGVTAVEVNVTAVAPSQAGFVTAFSGGIRPVASTVNYATGQIVANSATVRLSSAGGLNLYTGWGATDLVVDVVGYWTTPATGLTWAEPTGIDPAQGIPQSISCPITTFCGAVDARGNALIYDGMTWSAAKQIDPGVVLTSVSCPTADFCVAVDQFGAALTYSGSTWSAQFIGHVTSYLTYASLNSVSCPTRTFCVAVDNYGYASTYNGGAWGAATKLDPSGTAAVGGITSVSCASATFCAAVDGAGSALTFNGRSWTAPTKIDVSGRLRSVSCPSESFCVAADPLGNAFIWNGSRWSAPSKISTGTANDGLSSVSCPTTTFCSVVDGAGNVLGYDGTSWTAPENIAVHGGGLTSVSCPTAGDCVAADFYGAAYTDDGGGWSSPTSFDPLRGNLGSVSCATTTYCLALDAYGPTLAWHGSGWANTPDSLPPTTRTRSMSCPTTTFCVAVGSSSLGQAVTFDGTKWSVPRKLGAGEGVSSVSCPTSTFCMAVNGAGTAYTFDGTGWSAPVMVDSNGGNGLAAVSCASAGFCVAVERNGGGVVSFDGNSWTGPVAVDPAGGSFTSVSCSAASFCVAVDQDGNAVVYNGTSWSKPQFLGYGEQLTSVSCATAEFCAAVTARGDVVTFDGVKWSEPASIDDKQFLQSIACPSPTLCVAVDADGNAVVGRHA